MSSTPFATSELISSDENDIADEACSKSTWFFLPTTVTVLSISFCSFMATFRFLVCPPLILTPLTKVGWYPIN